MKTEQEVQEFYRDLLAIRNRTLTLSRRLMELRVVDMMQAVHLCRQISETCGPWRKVMAYLCDDLGEPSACEREDGQVLDARQFLEHCAEQLTEYEAKLPNDAGGPTVAQPSAQQAAGIAEIYEKRSAMGMNAAED